MSNAIPQGYEAIELAERDATVDIAKHADDVDGARVGLALDEARAIAAQDPSLIYAVRSLSNAKSKAGRERASQREADQMAALAALSDSDLAASNEALETKARRWEAQFMSTPAWVLWALGQHRAERLLRIADAVHHAAIARASRR